MTLSHPTSTTRDVSPWPGSRPAPFVPASHFQTSLWLSVLVVCLQGCGSLAGPAPPAQPATGPGGADYKHASVEAFRTGSGPDEFWIFTPADPKPEEAPLVFFMHGWGAVHPRAYGAWLQHIVRKGHIVVYPRFQHADKLRTSGDVMLAGAQNAVKNAWTTLTTTGPVRPRADQVMWIGHSMGGVLAAKVAAVSGTLGLPPAGALFLVQPGGHDVVPVGDLSGVPASAIVEILTGDEDTIAGDSGARAILAALGTGDSSRRVEMLHMRSERRSRPRLIADHFAPAGTTEGFPPTHIVGGDTDMPGGPLRDMLRERRQDRYAVDALDFYGFWKVGDALMDHIFRGQNLDFGHGNTDQQTFMGRLSDGSPVVPLVVE